MSDTIAELQRTESYLALDPGNVLLLCKAIDLAMQARDLPRARAHVDAALRAQGGDPYVEVRHAHVLAAEGRKAEAAALFESLLARHPDAQIAMALARLRLQQGDAAAAAGVLQAYARGDAEPALLTLLLQALHHAGENSDALALVDRHMARLASDPAFLAAASLVCFDEEDFERAFAFSRAALAGDVRPLPALVVAASLALQRQDVPLAASLYAEALNHQPQEFRALLGLGIVYLLLRRASDALPLLQRAVELVPDHQDALESLGWSHALLGDLPQAQAVFQRMAMQPNAALATTHALAGRSKEAAAYLALARAEGDPLAQVAATVLARGSGGLDQLHSALQASLTLH